MCEVPEGLLGLEVGSMGKLRLKDRGYLPAFSVEGGLINFSLQAGFREGEVVEVVDVEVTNATAPGGIFLRHVQFNRIYYVQPGNVSFIKGLEPIPSE